MRELQTRWSAWWSVPAVLIALALTLAPAAAIGAAAPQEFPGVGGQTDSNPVDSSGGATRAAEAVLMLEPSAAYDFKDWLLALRDRGITLDHVFPPAGGLLVLRGGLSAREASAQMPPGTVVHSVSPEGADGKRLQATLGGRVMWKAHRALLGLDCADRAPDASPGEPLVGDALVRPEPQGRAPLVACSAASLYGSTSEYMLGSVTVTVILPESTCVLGCENWDILGVQEGLITLGITNGLNDLRNLYLSFGLAPSLAPSWTYHYIFGRTDGRAQIGSEPIWGPGPTLTNPLWLTDIYNNLGYGADPSVAAKADHFNGDQRASDGTDWAFTIFVVNSFWDLDGKFSDGRFGYAYLGGPYIMMTDDNDGWTIFGMNSVARHEASHIFYALDEYASSNCTCSESSGYVSTQNHNCRNSCSSNVACVMNDNVYASCSYTRGQVGWGDSDADAVPDPVDIAPETSLTAYSPDPTTNTTLTFSGNGSIQKRNNQNVYNEKCDINILKISNVQWRVDGGGWNGAAASDGAFDGGSESYTFTATVSAGAVHTFETRAVDELGQADASYASDTVTICNTITLSPSSLPGGTASVAYNQTVTASPAGTYGYAVTSGSLPPGLSLNPSNGAITGTPTTNGSSSFTITATDSIGCRGSLVYSLTIACPTITLTASLPGGTASTPYGQTVSASPGGTTYGYAVTSGSLPPGLSLDAATGAITGTPTVNGAYNFTITATGWGMCTGSQAYAVTIDCPTITLTASLPGGTASTPYGQTVSASPGGTTYGYAVTSGSLPPGLSLDSSTGAITGTPTVNGTYSFTVTATGWGTCTGSQAYAVTIACPTITLTASLPGGTASAPYGQTVSASPGGTTYGYAVTSGSIPPGLTLNPSTGAITGTPTVNGTYNFTVTATGWGTCTGSQAYAVTIACPTITLTASLPGGIVGTAYSQTVTAAPVGTTYGYAVTSGGLPTGLSLNPSTGALTGTPSAAGTFGFTITATGWGTCTGSQAYSVTMVCPTITLTPTALPGAVRGTPYSQALAANGGTAPYAFAVTGGSLPPGLTLSPAGLVSGTCLALGTYTFSVTATDVYGCGGSRAYAVAVYSVFFQDDLLRSKVCVDFATGAYTWQILSGAGAGVYAGTAIVMNGGAKVVNRPGAAHTLNLTYDAIRKKASGYLVPSAGVYAPLSDANTVNNAGGCP